MEDDKFFQYTKIILENITFWQVLVLVLILLLWLRPRMFAGIPANISKFRVGEVEIELREIREELAETKTQVEVLENDLEQERSKFDTVFTEFDPHAPVSELAATREALKAIAPSMSDLGPVREGLSEGATPQQLYAAAEVARTKRDPALFDDLVSCLDRLSGEADLAGIRLHTVWTLTSALHKTLIADIQHRPEPSLTRTQLIQARDVLDRLSRNPRVLGDRPDDPMKGVRGPAKWATDWITRGLKRLEDA